MEREKYTTEEVIAVIDWLLESYTFAELARESGLSESTLRRMQRYGKATEQTWKRLSRIMDELTFDEHKECLLYEEWGM